MNLPSVIEGASRVLNSPANWLGTGLAAGSVALVGLGWLSAGLLPVAVLAYGVGYGVGGLWFGWPRLSGPDWRELTFAASDDTLASTQQAIDAIRRLVQTNPNRQLSEATALKLLALCDSMDTMLQQWQRSSDGLSLEDTFHARNIALRYLPEALQRFWSIPSQQAHQRRLDNGLTADETLGKTVLELSSKVEALSAALAAHDTQSFLTHSQFISEKFGARATDQEGPVRLK